MLGLLSSAVQGLRKTMRTATRLTNLDVRNVSAVARPANRRPWLLVKNADGSLTVRTPARTYDDALMGRRLLQAYGILGDRYGSLLEVFESIRASPGPDKVARVRGALADFVASMEAAMPQMARVLDGNADADATIEKGALSRVKRVQQVVAETIANADIVEGSIAMGGKKSGVDLSKIDFDAITKSIMDAAVAELKKASSDRQDAGLESTRTPVDELQDAIAALMERRPGVRRDLAVFEVLMADQKLAARLKAYIAESDGGHEKALAEVYERATVTGFSKSAAEADRRASALLAKSDTLTRAQALDQVYGLDDALYKAAVAEGTYARSGETLADRTRQLKKSGAGSAAEQVEAKVAELLSKSDKLTRADALDRIFAENPQLYTDWSKGETVGV